jgi:hypothetical protein
MEVDPKDPVEVAKVLESYVNQYVAETDKLAGEVCKWHRTLQQNLARVCLRILVKIGEQEDFDLRNEDAVKVGRKLAAMEERGELFLRHI